MYDEGHHCQWRRGEPIPLRLLLELFGLSCFSCDPFLAQK
ncbi:hypothetical protein LINGRAHAP2_LOCUS1613 [Linum grandiflorum]